METTTDLPAQSSWSGRLVAAYMGIWGGGRETYKGREPRCSFPAAVSLPMFSVVRFSPCFFALLDFYEVSSMSDPSIFKQLALVTVC